MHTFTYTQALAKITVFHHDYYLKMHFSMLIFWCGCLRRTRCDIISLINVPKYHHMNHGVSNNRQLDCFYISDVKDPLVRKVGSPLDRFKTLGRQHNFPLCLIARNCRHSQTWETNLTRAYQKTWHNPGIPFTTLTRNISNGLWVYNPSLVNLHAVLRWNIMMKSGRNFAHVTTA